MEIKPCAFCGRTPTINRGKWPKWKKVECLECGIHVDAADAIAVWNDLWLPDGTMRLGVDARIIGGKWHSEFTPVLSKYKNFRVVSVEGTNDGGLAWSEYKIAPAKTWKKTRKLTWGGYSTEVEVVCTKHLNYNPRSARFYNVTECTPSCITHVEGYEVTEERLYTGKIQGLEWSPFGALLTRDAKELVIITRRLFYRGKQVAEMQKEEWQWMTDNVRSEIARLKAEKERREKFYDFSPHLPYGSFLYGESRDADYARVDIGAVLHDISIDDFRAMFPMAVSRHDNRVTNADVVALWRPPKEAEGFEIVVFANLRKDYEAAKLVFDFPDDFDGRVLTALQQNAEQRASAAVVLPSNFTARKALFSHVQFDVFARSGRFINTKREVMEYIPRDMRETASELLYGDPDDQGAITALLANVCNIHREVVQGQYALVGIYDGLVIHDVGSGTLYVVQFDSSGCVGFSEEDWDNLAMWGVAQVEDVYLSAKQVIGTYSTLPEAMRAAEHHYNESM